MKFLILFYLLVISLSDQYTIKANADSGVCPYGYIYSPSNSPATFRFTPTIDPAAFELSSEEKLTKDIEKEREADQANRDARSN